VLAEGEIHADGIFILKDSVALDQLVPGVDILENHFNVNRGMETNIPGLYAAGDCTGKPYQYLKAAGEGQVAALNAVSYLDKR
jgi:thioredoxin reductase (NADPH)